MTKRLPSGMRISSPMGSPEVEVENDRDREYARPEDRRTGIPALALRAQPRCQRINEALQLLLRARARDEAHRDSDEEAGGESVDRRPEVLRHLAGVKVQHRDPAPLDAGRAARGQREPMVRGRRG